MAKTMACQRSMELLRKEGWSVGKVERWIPQAGKFGKRSDLFGFIDIVAMRLGHNGIMGIQTTTKPQVKKHIDKILGIDEAVTWLRVGNSIEVHGWFKSGRLWMVKREPIDVGRFVKKEERS